MTVSSFDPSNMIASSAGIHRKGVDFTPEALVKVVAKVKEKGVGGVRFGLTGGGCAGFSYEFDYAEEGKMLDTPIDFGDFTLWLDPLSEDMLEGTLISWKVEGLNEGFEFDNPQQTSACGCGISVSF